MCTQDAMNSAISYLKATENQKLKLPNNLCNRIRNHMCLS